MAHGPVRAAVAEVRASAYTIPTDAPESDGTLAWDSTTLVLAQVRAGAQTGLGYSYTHAAAADLIRTVLGETVRGRQAVAVSGCRAAMLNAVRNLGGSGLSASAIAAVDTALWDLKARLLEVPLVALLGPVRDGVPVYGSGGFTSYSLDRLQWQLAGWAEAGIRRVKMKVGRRPTQDAARVRAAREAVGDAVELFVDANGAFTPPQALALADALADYDVRWFEEPVSSDDLAGLAEVRRRAPAGMDIAAGEYGYRPVDFRRLLEAGAVDVLQADATRCGGITGFLEAGVLAAAHARPLSAHTAPALHLHPSCAVEGVRHVEYFHDHVRIESMLFDGVPRPEGGVLYPDPSRPGLGLDFKHADAEPYRVR